MAVNTSIETFDIDDLADEALDRMAGGKFAPASCAAGTVSFRSPA